VDDPYEWPSEKSRALREVIATAPELARLREVLGLTDALAKVGNVERERAYAAAEARGYRGWETLVFAEGFARGRLEVRDTFAHKVLLRAGMSRFGIPDGRAQVLMGTFLDDESIARVLARLSEATSWNDLLTLPDA